MNLLLLALIPALALADSVPLSPAGEAAVRYRLGVALVAEGEVQAALQHFEAVISLTPTWALGQLAYARARRALDLPLEPTLAALARACQLAPQNPSAHHDHGLALEAAGRLDEAAAAYRQAVEIAPTHAEAHARLGLLAMERGDVSAACSHLRVATGLDPDDAVSQTRLAEALERAGLHGEAGRELRALVARDKANAFPLRRLAAFLQRRDREAEAEAALAAAKRIERRARPKRRLRPLGPRFRAPK